MFGKESHIASNRSALPLLALQLLAAIAAGAVAAGPKDSSEQIMFDRAVFLCDWSRSRVPPARPGHAAVALRICTDLEAMSYADVRTNMDAWFQQFEFGSPTRGDRMQTDFEAAFWDHKRAVRAQEERDAAPARAEQARREAEAKADEDARISANELARRREAEKASAAAKARRDAALIRGLPTASVPALCATYRSRRLAAALSEIRRRGEFSERDLSLISAGSANVGMTEAALRCSLGDGQRINRSVGPWGVHKQYVYGRGFVYVENGVVTSFQD